MKKLIKTLTLTAAGLVVGAVALKRVNSVSELGIKNADGNFVKINNSRLLRGSIGTGKFHRYISGNKKAFISSLETKMKLDEILDKAMEIKSKGTRYQWSSL